MLEKNELYIWNTIYIFYNVDEKLIDNIMIEKEYEQIYYTYNQLKYQVADNIDAIVGMIKERYNQGNV